MSQLSGTISPYMTGAAIQGNTNFSAAGAGANLFQGAQNLVSNPTAAIGSLASNYANSYKSTLDLQQGQYRDILKGYGTNMANQVGNEGLISAGYTSGLNKVMDTLGLQSNGTPTGTWGVAAPAAQAIADTYAQQKGSVLQNAVNSGIGGTSALANLERGPALDATKAYGALGANLAQTAAGYETSWGQAGLNYANQANMQNSALSQKELDFMAGVQIPYPSAQATGSMISGALGVQAAQAAAARSGAGNRGAVVNPFGSSSAGSQGHTPFISGSAGSPSVMGTPQATGMALGGQKPAAPQYLTLPGGAAGVNGSIAGGLAAATAATSAGGAGGFGGLVAAYAAQQAALSGSGSGGQEMSYTVDSEGNPQLQDSEGNYYDPSTGEWTGNAAFDSSGGFSGGE